VCVQSVDERTCVKLESGSGYPLAMGGGGLRAGAGSAQTEPSVSAAVVWRGLPLIPAHQHANALEGFAGAMIVHALCTD